MLLRCRGAATGLAGSHRPHLPNRLLLQCSNRGAQLDAACCCGEEGVGSNGACLPLCMPVILLWGSAQGAACSHCLCISAALLACLPAWCSCLRGGQRARTRPAASLITTMQPPVSAALLQRLLLWMVACWSVVPQLPRMPVRSPRCHLGSTCRCRPDAMAAASRCCCRGACSPCGCRRGCALAAPRCRTSSRACSRGWPAVPASHAVWWRSPRIRVQDWALWPGVLPGQARHRAPPGCAAAVCRACVAVAETQLHVGAGSGCSCCDILV